MGQIIRAKLHYNTGTAVAASASAHRQGTSLEVISVY